MTQQPVSLYHTRRYLLMGLLLFTVALVPRIQYPGDFVTVDEIIHWFKRSEVFREALIRGDYAETNRTGHPGVTTMWLGTLGIEGYHALVQLGIITPINEIQHPGSRTLPYTRYVDDPMYRVLLRLPVAIVTSLAVVAGWLLQRQLFDGRVAFIGALLWATDPFLVAHSQLLHVDALLTSWVALATFGTLVAFRIHRRPIAPLPPIPLLERWGTLIYAPLLIVSAMAAGLAFLTKSPSLVLLPMLAAVVCIAAVTQVGHNQEGYYAWRHIFTCFAGLILGALAWLMIAGGVWLVLWPAAWVSPYDAVATVVREIIVNGAQPHSGGSFFLGQPVDDPGPRFYPVALVLRLTPWAFVGIIGAVLLLPQRRKERWLVLDGRLAVILLVILTIFALMTIAGKKHDRYLLPAFPMLMIVAAHGLVRLFDLSVRMLGQIQPTRTLEFVTTTLFAAILIMNLAWYHPYQLAYYNPLVGGGKMATYAMVVGWGEGAEQVGDYIRAQPDGCDQPVATWYAWVLVPYLCSDVMPMEWIAIPDMNNYAVMYVNQIQRDRGSEAYALLRDVPPVYTVVIHGIPYAHVYQLAPERAHGIHALFEPGIYLDSYDLGSENIARSGAIYLYLQWQARGEIRNDLVLFAHLLDAEGNRVAQLDVPPAGPDMPTSTWQLGHYVTFTHQIPVAHDLPPGDYWLALGLYDPETFERVPVSGAPILPEAPDAGGNSVILPVSLGGK